MMVDSPPSIRFLFLIFLNFQVKEKTQPQRLRLSLRYLIKKERSKEIIFVTLSPFDTLSIAIFCDVSVKKSYGFGVNFYHHIDID